MYLTRIRAVFNLCIDKYEHFGVSINYPFRKYKIPKVKPRKTIALTKEQLNEIIKLDLNGKERAKRAQLAFITSLFTLGTNATDLFDISLSDNIRIEYERNKTKKNRDDNAFISIKIEPELKPYLELLKGSGEYVFCFREWYKNKPQFNKGINEGLKQIADILNEKHKKEDQEKNFIFDFNFYDARRTIASVMRNKLNISKDDISLCLNHADTSHRMTDIYIETDFSILDKCGKSGARCPRMPKRI